MTVRDIVVVSTVATLLALTPGLAAAQTADTPRTAWGDPDLGGIWDYRSLTPMSRPRAFVDKAVLTEEESAAFLRQQLAFYEALDDGVRPHSGLSQFGGDGRGHWEGDTLVVESSHFDGELTMIGTEPQRLTERFTREGDTIQYEFTVDDPDLWETAWTARVPIRKTDGPVFEYACHEGNYAVVNMLSIARAEDRAAAAGSR